MQNFFIFITLLGDWKIITGGVIATVILLLYKKKFRTTRIVAIGLITAEILVQVLKQLFNASRPLVADPFLFETDGGFPSGHTTMSVIFYGMLAYFILCNQSIRKPIRYILFAILLVIPLLISYSRFYLNVHFPYQVIISIFIGIAWLAGTIFLLRQNKEKAGS